MKAFVFPCLYSFRPSLSPKLLGNDFKNWRTQLVAVCLLALGSLWSPPKAQAQAVNFGSVNVLLLRGNDTIALQQDHDGELYSGCQ